MCIILYLLAWNIIETTCESSLFSATQRPMKHSVQHRQPSLLVDIQKSTIVRFEKHQISHWNPSTNITDGWSSRNPPSYHQKKGHVCVPGRSPHHSWHRFRWSKTTSENSSSQLQGGNQKWLARGASHELKVRRAKREGERGNHSLGRVRKEPEFVLQKWGLMLLGKKSLLEFMLMLGEKSSKYP